MNHNRNVAPNNYWRTINEARKFKVGQNVWVWFETVLEDGKHSGYLRNCNIIQITEGGMIRVDDPTEKESKFIGRVSSVHSPHRIYLNEYEANYEMLNHLANEYYEEGHRYP
jgi:hypothetical protein